MSTTSELSGMLQQAFESPTRGVVGLVDDLLRNCPTNGLQLDWHVDSCRIRFLGNGAEELIIRSLRRSIFRAVLARVAALCNERNPNSVSPYGGQGELSIANDYPQTVKVIFTNTTVEQKLVLIANG